MDLKGRERRLNRGPRLLEGPGSRRRLADREEMMGGRWGRLVRRRWRYWFGNGLLTVGWVTLKAMYWNQGELECQDRRLR